MAGEGGGPRSAADHGPPNAGKKARASAHGSRVVRLLVSVHCRPGSGPRRASGVEPPLPWGPALGGPLPPWHRSSGERSGAEGARRSGRQCSAIRRPRGPNCGRWWSGTQNTAWHWVQFPIPIPKSSKQLALSVSNANSEFQASMSTSKQGLTRIDLFLVEASRLFI